MTTALDLITDALLEIGVAESGQSVNAEDGAIGLRYLNRLLQRWTNAPAMFAVLPEVSVTLTGAGSYTIGPSGGTVAVRPIRIDGAVYVDAGGLESPVTVLSRAQWDAIAVKSVTSSVVSEVWYDATVTDGTVHVYPKGSSGTLKLQGASLLTSFAGLSTAVTLPDGYESAIVPSLAIDLAPAFQVPVSQDLRIKATGAIRAIKRMNTEPLHLSVGLVGGQTYQIERGY